MWTQLQRRAGANDAAVRAAALALLAATAAAAAALPFRSCGAPFFSRNLSGLEVAGLSLVPSATSADACLASCCAVAAPQCSVWQWCPGGLECGAAASCWIGALGGATTPRAGWVSFATPSTCRDPHVVRPTSYYISPTGSDSAAGTSPAAAWRSATPANAFAFAPGDSILFEAVEHSLATGLVVHEAVTVASYGGGGEARIVVDASSSAAITVLNTGGVLIANISVAHNGAAKAKFNGVSVLSTDASASPRFSGVSILDVTAAGFVNGISVDADGCRGFEHVLIARCSATGSLGTGIASSGNYGATCFSHADIVVQDSSAYDNPGDAQDTQGWSGSGIVLSGVDGAVIERSLAFGNGNSNGHQGGGPCGIWFWQANNGTITHCVSHSNGNGKEAGTSGDGCGFDLDGGTSNSVVEYSLSYNNSGPGFLLCSFGGPRPAVNLTVRFSVSFDDGERSDNGATGLNLYTPDSLTNIVAHGNTFVSHGGPRTALVAPFAYGKPASGFLLESNALLALGGGPLLSMPTAQLAADSRILGNAFWAGSPGAFEVDWAGKTYTNLAAFRLGTGQEAPAAGGSDADPGLSNDGAFFQSCVQWPEGAPALPNSPALDRLRGFSGC